MKAKLALVALFGAAAMIAMPVNGAEAGSHKGWHKRHCMFSWLHCHCKKSHYRVRKAKRWMK